MSEETRTIVTFKSTAFNMTEPRDYFINPCCYGDDVAKWLMIELRQRGIQTDEKPGQEDFGWYLNFHVPRTDYTLVIGHRPGDDHDEGTWIIWLERRRGLMGSLLGSRKRGIELSAVDAIHSILSGSLQIRDIRWHFQRDFEKEKDSGASTPSKA
jgi:hypothetical protein